MSITTIVERAPYCIHIDFGACILQNKLDSDDRSTVYWDYNYQGNNESATTR